MNKFLVGIFIILFLTSISVVVISCVSERGSTAPTTQQSQTKKATTKGG